MTTQLTEEATTQVADLGWTHIGYNEVGTGDPVVLIHGGGLGATSWSNFVLNIGPLSEHFRILAMDVPGYGKSDPFELKDESRNTINGRAIKGLLDALGIERASCVGNSMGGAAALTFAVDYPDRVNKVVMMGAAPVGQRAMFTPTLPTEGIKALQHVVADPSFESFRKMFDLMVYDASQVPDDALKRRAESVNETHRLNLLASYRNNVQRDLMPELPKVTCPVLLIHGRNDTMSHLENSLALLPYLRNAELHVYNNCGHWAQYEHANKFNHMVLDFLQIDD